MNVIPFARHRFAPSDVRRFQDFAAPRLAQRQWTRIERRTGSQNDRILVTIRDIEFPVMLFQRDRDGVYGIYFLDMTGWHVIRQGATAEACMGMLERFQ